MKGPFKRLMQSLAIMSMLLFPCLEMRSQVLNEVVSYNSTIISPSSEESYDWIEIYNDSDAALDLSTFYLTDDMEEPMKWQFPLNTVMDAHEYLVVWLVGNGAISTVNELQANFKLNSEGESLFLYSEDLELVDSSPDWQIQQDLSIGRIAGTLDWYYLDETSPGAENLAGNAFLSAAQFPEVSQQSGVYVSSILWEFTKDNALDEIRFTTDGSEPTENSALLEGPFLLSSSAILKLKVFREGALPSGVLPLSYVIGEDLALDVMCISGDPDELFGPSGIYTNYYSGQEKKVNVELFVNGVTAFKQNMGVKIHAPDARDQKSLRLYARSEYGKKEVTYPLFDEKSISSFKRLVLRNGGNDGAEIGESHIRDILGHDLYLESNQLNGNAAYKRVNVFINGEYWGIYNLRERQDEHYMESNYGYEESEVDFLEYDYAEPGLMKTISGDWDNWDALEDYVSDHDLSQDEFYATVEQWVDIDNYIDYQIFQIVMGNQDWCNNNTKFWKPINDGKWRWIMWDVDYALGTYEDHDIGQPEFDFLTMAMTWCGWGSGDYAWLFSNLLENDEFKTKFVTRTQDILNTSFRYTHLSSRADELIAEIEPDLDRQFDRWGSSLSSWQESVDELDFFTEFRPEFVLDNMSAALDFSTDRHELSIDISSELAGEIGLNTIVLNEYTIGANESSFPWSGIYFQEQLIELEAFEYPNYTFSHWEGDLYSEDPVIMLYLEEDMHLMAVYEEDPEENPNYSGLVINELLSANSSVYPDNYAEFEDWIELYNGSNSAINLSGLYLSDNEENLLKFQVPLTTPQLEIEPGGYAMFFADDQILQGENHTNFQLDSDGESLYLSYLDAENVIQIIDQITFNQIPENFSYGRSEDGDNSWMLFVIPTPNASNEVLTDLPEWSEDLEIVLYPNPSSGILSIRLEGLVDSDQQIQVYNSFGQLVFSSTLIKSLSTLDLSHLGAGLYIIEIGSEEILNRQKVILK